MADNQISRDGRDDGDDDDEPVSTRIFSLGVEFQHEPNLACF